MIHRWREIQPAIGICKDAGMVFHAGRPAVWIGLARCRMSRLLAIGQQIIEIGRYILRRPTSLLGDRLA